MNRGDRLFADVNAVLDFVAKRGEHYVPMAKLLALNRHGQIVVAAAASTFPFVYYQLTERLSFGFEVANSLLLNLSLELELIPVDGAIVAASFANPIEDLEDAVQYACAEAFGAQIILTRDAAGFEGMPIPSTSPAALLAE